MSDLDGFVAQQRGPSKLDIRPRWTWVAAIFLLAWILALVSPVGAPHTGAQESPTWTTYANGDDVRALALRGSEVWAGTKGGGVVRWDPADGLYIQYLRPQDGLAGNDVRDIAVAPDGRLWFATDRGVSVFAPDTDEWTTYNRTNTGGGLTSDDVTAIAIIPNGTVWVGTAQFWDGDEWVGGGVSRLQGGTWTHFSIADGLPSQNITDIAVDPDSGEVWVTTRRYRVYEEPTEITSGGWVFWGGGVAVYRLGSWTAYSRNPSDPSSFPSSDDINCVAIDSEGRKWFGLAGGGINALDGSIWYRFTKTADGLSDNNILAIAVDPLDRIWAATAAASNIGSGVSVLDHRGTLGNADDDIWDHFNASDGLASDTVRAIVADGVDQAWFGTSDPMGDGYGVTRFDRGAWFTLAMADRGGLPSNFITAMAFDSLGRLWVGTERRGIAILDAGNWIRHTKDSTDGGLPSDRVTGLAFDPDGRAWIATEGIEFDHDLLRYVDGGVARYDGSEWRVYTMENTARRGLVATTVAANTLAGAFQVPANFDNREAADAAFETGYLMFGDDPTLYGYISYNTFTKAINIVPALQRDVLFGTPIYSVELGVANNRLTAIAVGEGRVWVGAGHLRERAGLGLSIFDLGSETWETVRYPTIASNLISDIAVDEERHRVWLATTYWGQPPKGGGVSMYDGGWTNYDQSNSGLLAYLNDVRSVAVGRDGEVWIGAFDFTGDNYSGRSPVNAVVNRLRDGDWSQDIFTDEGIITSLALGPSGRLWAATSRERQGPDESDLQYPYAPLGGVKVLADGQWLTYNVDNSRLASNDIRRVAVAPDGRLWFATAGRGLSTLGSGELPAAPTPTATPLVTNTPIPTRTPTMEPTPVLPGVIVLPSRTPTPGPTPTPIPPSEVPEAGTFILLGSGLTSLAGYAALRWRAAHRQPRR